MATSSYLVEVKQRVIAKLAGTEESSPLGNLKAVGHRDGVENLPHGTKTHWKKKNACLKRREKAVR